MTDFISLDLADAEDLARRACLAVGANNALTDSLVEATLSAALHGPPTLGFPHFVDYLDSLRSGRINGDPQPSSQRPFPAFIRSDADRGIAQLAFDLVFDHFVAVAREQGVAVLTIANSYTTGELGYYLRKLAASGLAGLAATNANAFMVANSGSKAVYSTNPIGFTFPMGRGEPPLMIDQSASATAYVNLVAAAHDGKAIPPGWAVDCEGNETTDPARAITGSLLPFGGRKGANIALMVEMLSAGLSGGNWSLDAAPYNSGADSPAVGLTILAIMPGEPELGLVDRASSQVDRLRLNDVYVPGIGGRVERAMRRRVVEMPQPVYAAISKIAEG